MCNSVPACMFGLVEADCVVDGIKPTVSVDSIGLLAPMGWMNAECCGLEWEGRSAFFSSFLSFLYCMCLNSANLSGYIQGCML